MNSIIVAQARNRAIGRNNELPWRLAEDLKRFKELTVGHPVIMGRRTFDSILAQLQRPLPGRENIVVTRDQSFKPLGAVAVWSVKEALRHARGQDAFIIGGAQIYAETIGSVDRLYVTEVDTVIDNADAFFPEIDPHQWEEVGREAFDKDDDNEYDCHFVIYDRKTAHG